MWIIGKHRHLSDEQLSEYVSGRLSDSEMARLQRVLDSCDSCRVELLNWQATSAALRDLPQLELPRSFVMLEAPAPAPAPMKKQGTGFNPLAGLGRLPALSPWAYAGAASLVALAGALIITTQGGLPWWGAGDGFISDAATEQAALAVASQSDSGAETLRASQPQGLPAPPQAATLPASQVEEGDEEVSVMAARSMITREAASRKFQEAPGDMGEEAATLTQMPESEVEASLEASAAPMPQATVPQATMAPQQAMAEIARAPSPTAAPTSAPAAAPAMAGVETMSSEEPQPAEVDAAAESPGVEARAAPGLDAPAVAESAGEAGVAPRQASGYALDAAQAPTPIPSARVDAATAVPKIPPVAGAKVVTREVEATPAPGQNGGTPQPSDGGTESGQVKTTAGEGQESGTADAGTPDAIPEAGAPAPQAHGIVAGDGPVAGQLSATAEPSQGVQAAEEESQSEGVPDDAEPETSDGEPTRALPNATGAGPGAPATPLIPSDAVRNLAVAPQGGMAERAEEKRRAAATSPGAGEFGSQGESNRAPSPSVEETGLRLVWVVAGFLALVALALVGLLGYWLNRSRKTTD